ncbi:hypothetical protein WG904_15310 [Pedobacter sp. Du54]|uniref:hypothetical protein n=1 Tax=Pedobacter anseongensis TaxID=3133439 RepID=UPI0030B76D4E
MDKSLKACLFGLVLIITLPACKQKPIDYSSAKNSSIKNIKFETLSLDTLTLPPFNSSYIGQTALYDKYIYFIDSKFGFVYKFDQQGKILQRFLGQGTAKNELPIKSIMLFSFLPNGNSIFIGTGYDCYMFDLEFNRINDFQINWHSSKTQQQLINNPDLEDNGMFSLLYNGRIFGTNETLYFPVASQHPKLNPTLANYAEDVKIIGKMNLENGYVEKVYGKLPPIYKKNIQTLAFGYAYIDAFQEKKTLTSFPVDSLIYVVNDDFEVLNSFGFQGRDMDLRYKNQTDPRKFSENYKEQVKVTGHYTFMKHFQDLNLTFRGYHKNRTATTDGLQIYLGKTLISDIDVPIGFRVEGYIAPYFYSNIKLDIENATAKIYRFKL